MWSVVGVILATVAAVQAQTVRTLVVLADNSLKETHSHLFTSLEGRGHNITYKEASASDVDVFAYDERAYENLLVLVPAADRLVGKLNVQRIMRFLDEGGNVLVAAENNPGTMIQDLARYAGFSTPTDSGLTDFFNVHESDNGSGTLVTVDVSKGHQAVFGDAVKAPVLYKGIGFKQGRTQNSFAALRASSTSYLGSSVSPILLGQDGVLVGAMQARNNARMVVVGSLYALGDAAIKNQVTGDKGTSTTSGNAAFTESISQWVFGEKAVLRSVSVNVTNLAPKAPGVYTVKDEVEYEIVLEELKDGHWQPYEGHTDVQMMYTMMDPYVITPLTPRSKGSYVVKFTLPDVYGLFTFKAIYNRMGYSNINHEHVEVIRPLRNTMHARFLVSAYPYYVSSFSMMVGVFLLSFVFLYHKDPSTKQKKE